MSNNLENTFCVITIAIFKFRLRFKVSFVAPFYFIAATNKLKIFGTLRRQSAFLVLLCFRSVSKVFEFQVFHVGEFAF